MPFFIGEDDPQHIQSGLPVGWYWYSQQFKTPVGPFKDTQEASADELLSHEQMNPVIQYATLVNHNNRKAVLIDWGHYYSRIRYVNTTDEIKVLTAELSA